MMDLKEFYLFKDDLFRLFYPIFHRSNIPLFQFCVLCGELLNPMSIIRAKIHFDVSIVIVKWLSG